MRCPADRGHFRFATDRLTLARLLHEPALRDSRLLSGGNAETVDISWCLTWEEAAAGDTALDDVLVYARADRMDARGFASIRARRPAAVLLAGACDANGVASTLAPVPVVLAGPGVRFAEVAPLVAELALSHETHVLRYGLGVQRALSELLYRGAGLDALCAKVAQISNSCGAGAGAAPG